MEEEKKDEVELVVNGKPTIVSTEKLSEFEESSKFKIIEKDGRKILLEKMNG